MRRPIPGQKHHWFPKALARAAWAGADGKVIRVNSRGHTRRFHPSAIGYTPDSHNILSKGGSPWDATFEPEFDNADNAFPKLIKWINKIDEAHPDNARLNGVDIKKDDREILSQCISSLIVRSPRLRRIAENQIAHFQVNYMGFSEPQNVHQTAGSNIRRMQRAFSNQIMKNGKFNFLISDNNNLIFGDGFLNNVRPSADHQLNSIVLAPITPKISALWFNPISYPAFPTGVSTRISEDETIHLNDIVQIYSKDHIFCYGKTPVIHDSFKYGEHHMLTWENHHHMTPFINNWMNETIKYCCSD